MHEFFDGLIAGIAMLGGLCAFIYWVFNLLEKRLEGKIDHLEKNLEQKIDRISTRLDEVIIEQADQRKRTDQLYQTLIQLVSERKAPTTNP